MGQTVRKPTAMDHEVLLLAGVKMYSSSYGSCCSLSIEARVVVQVVLVILVAVHEH